LGGAPEPHVDDNDPGHSAAVFNWIRSSGAVVHLGRRWHLSMALLEIPRSPFQSIVLQSFQDGRPVPGTVWLSAPRAYRVLKQLPVDPLTHTHTQSSIISINK